MFSRSHLFVREDFFRFLDLEIKRARRYQNLFGVLRFELYNSGPGVRTNPEKGLKSVSKLLRDEIRETDILGQTKRNEIMILLPYCDSSGSEVVYTRLDRLIRDFHFGNHEFRINSSYVCFPTEGTDMAEILNKLEAHKVDVRMSVTR